MSLTTLSNQLPASALTLRTSSEVVSKRQGQLEAYLLHIISISQFAVCDAVVSFLESSQSFVHLNARSQVSADPSLPRIGKFRIVTLILIQMSSLETTPLRCAFVRQ